MTENMNPKGSLKTKSNNLKNGMETNNYSI